MGVGLTLCYLYVLAMGCVFCCAGALGTSLTINEYLLKKRLTKSDIRQSVLAGLLFWFFLTQFCSGNRQVRHVEGAGPPGPLR